MASSVPVPQLAKMASSVPVPKKGARIWKKKK